MATYKGIGYELTTGRTRTGTNADDISFDSLITAVDGVNVTGIGLTVANGTTTDTLTVTGDASIAGDLAVTGDIISRGAVNLVVEDNFIDLNFANSTTTAEAGGLTVQMNRTAAFTASTVTTFVAGSAGVSNPTFTSTNAGSSSLFAAGDVVVMTGATQEGNNGLYVVSAVNQASFPQIVSIKGVGTVTVDPATPWAQNQFEAETGATASAFKTDMFVQLVADGSANFEDAGGVTIPKGTLVTAYYTAAVESNFTANGGYGTVSSTLQSAYNGGNTVSTNAGSDIPLAITLQRNGSGFAINGSTAGVGVLDLGGTTALNSYALAASGAPSSITSTGQNLTVQTATSGNLNLVAAATLDIDAVAVDLTSTGGLTAALSGAPSSITSTSQNLTLATATSGVLKLDAAGLLDIDAAASLDIDVTGSFDVLASTTFSIDGTGASNVTATSGNLTVSTATAGNLILASAEAVDVDGTAISVDGTAGVSIGGAGAASDFTSAGQNLTVQTTTSGTLAVTSAAILDLNGVTVNADATGALSLQGAISGDLTLAADTASTQTLSIVASNANVGNVANIDMDADGAVTIDSVGAASLAAAANSNVTISAGTTTAHTGEARIISAFPQLVKRIKAASSGLTAGDAIVLSHDGVDGLIAGRADADAIGTARVSGIALETTSAGAETLIAISGVVKNVTCTDSINLATDRGQPVYASTTAGSVSKTPPSGVNDVIFQVGICVGGASNAWEILLQPQFIMEIG